MPVRDKKVVVAIVMFLLCGRTIAAAVSWTGINLANWGSVWYWSDVESRWFEILDTQRYMFASDIYGEGGKYAWIYSNMYGHIEDGALYLKHEDFSGESMNPTFNWWALVNYGEVVSEDTFNSLTRIEDFYGAEYVTGGTPVENPSDFYMAFKACESVFVTGVGDVPGEAWYGWVHVSVGDNLEMTLLDEGINLYGGPLVVGAIPEPSAGALLLLGLAALVLRRRRESYAEQFSVEPCFAFAKHGGETCAGPYLAKTSGNPLKTAPPQGVSPQRAWSSTQRHGGTKAQSVF